jgi:hypothetical protein
MSMPRLISPLPIAALLMLVRLLPGVVDACVEQTYTARAVDQSTGLPLYQEHHRDTICEGIPFHTVVTYLGVDGDTVATKSLDFSRHLMKPDVLTEDRRTGYREGPLFAVTPSTCFDANIMVPRRIIVPFDLSVWQQSTSVSTTPFAVTGICSPLVQASNSILPCPIGCEPSTSASDASASQMKF